MNFRVYILAIVTVIVGLVELIVGGILPMIATDLNISVSAAGQLITVFAIVFAISGPVLLSVTSTIERKKLYLISLSVFFLGNILTYFSPNYTFVMIARVITAMSAALITVLSLTITTRIVKREKRVRALGFIYMGISSALVLGIPIGIIVTKALNWRTVFLGIAILSLVAIVLIQIFLQPLPARQRHSILEQVKALRNVKLVTAHITTILILAGHYTMYAYFAPFLEATMNFNEYWISLTYFIFGLAAVSGGAIGGIIAGKVGSIRALFTFIGLFIVTLFTVPMSTFSVPVFFAVVIFWGILSWGHSPPTQDYLIEADPKHSDIHQSLNNSAIQVGIALGSAIGGIAIQQTGSVTSMAPVGSLIILFALVSFYISISSQSSKKRAYTE
ncbi:MAG TPA: MFS transporter [Bacillota bacterium]|nr:MFS transporter [Bacillota bacterium]